MRRRRLGGNAAGEPEQRRHFLGGAPQAHLQGSFGRKSPVGGRAGGRDFRRTKGHHLRAEIGVAELARRDQASPGI